MTDLNRHGRLVGSMFLTAAAALAGVATASALLNDGSDAPARASAVPGSQSAEARADDPRGGFPFGVLVWRNEAGETCAALGRRVGERITDPSGERDYPLEDGGGCVDLRSLPGDVDVRRSGEHRRESSSRLDSVTVVWGLAKPGIVEVRVRAERSVRVARVTPRGAFVMTFPGAMTSELDVVAVTEGDRQRSSTFPAVSSEIRDRILHPRTGEQIRREIEAMTPHE